MNLKLVTWDINLTQFLVDAATNEEAIKKAIDANMKYGDVSEIEEEIKDESTYTVETVDLSLLSEIFARWDWHGAYGEAIIFDD